MRRLIGLVSAVVVLLASAVFTAPVARADGDNVITDIALRRCIAATMRGYAVPMSAPDAPNGDYDAMGAWIASDAVSVSQVDLANFAASGGGIQLWCPDMGITTLDGLQYLAAAPAADEVTWANFSGNQITDASLLGGLHGLTWVNLTDNQVSDAGFLATLPELEQLQLNGNQITSIAGLATSSPQGLWQLQASGNQITDIGDLSGLVALQEVDLSDNQISDVSSLAGLPALTELDLSENAISDVSALIGSNMPNLETLNLNYNKIDDISAFATAYMPVLTEIDLCQNSVSDVMSLGQGVFTDLEVLDLSENNISDSSHLSALEQLGSLIWLDLDNNSISDVTPLANLVVNDPDLRWLILFGNEISDITLLLPYMQWMADAWPSSAGDSWLTDYPDYCADNMCLTVRLDGNLITDASGLPERTGYTSQTRLGASLMDQNIDGAPAKVGDTVKLPDIKPTPGHGPLTWKSLDASVALNSDGTITFEEAGWALVCWEDNSIYADTVDGEDGTQETWPGFSGCVSYPVGDNNPGGHDSETGGSVVPNHGSEAVLLLVLAAGLAVGLRYRASRKGLLLP